MDAMRFSKRPVEDEVELKDLDEQPFMVIEEPFSQYFTWGGRKKVESIKLAKQRLPFIKTINVIEQSFTQVYVSQRLDVPHYQVRASRSKDL